MSALPRADLAHAARAWLYYAGAAEPLRDALPSSLAWLRTRWEAGDDHLPLGLVHDLGLLLLRGREFRFASARDLAHWPPDERAARLAYEDRVLGRWSLDPSVTEAHVAVAGMPAAQRDAAVAHAVGLALARPLRERKDLARGNPAHLRALAGEIAADAPDETFAERAARVGPEWAAWGAAQLASAVSALPARRLFRPEDLWEIAHLPDLPSESARLALREIHAAASRVGPAPASVATGVKRRAREVHVDRETADQYPAGGFDAVSTRGTFENLVRSEVAYVGEGQTSPGGIDLFDVRFVEGELLYYTRDESPLLDARRAVTVVIDRPAELRHKQPALPAQTLVMVEGLALALQADLVRLFGPAGSRFELVWRAESVEDREAAGEERALVGLTLAAETAHRRAAQSVADKWSDVPEANRVVFSPRARDAKVKSVAWVRVGDEAWQAPAGPVDAARGYPALRELADALLLAIAG